MGECFHLNYKALYRSGFLYVIIFMYDSKYEQKGKLLSFEDAHSM